MSKVSKNKNLKNKKMLKAIEAIQVNWQLKSWEDPAYS